MKMKALVGASYSNQIASSSEATLEIVSSVLENYELYSVIRVVEKSSSAISQFDSVKEGFAFYNKISDSI